MARKGEHVRTGGKPKGYKAPATRTKDAMREYVRKRVAAELGPMLDAQIAHAKGLQYLVTRDKKTGKFVRVGPAMASQLKHESIQVWEKDPSIAAFTDLANRAMDKPAEQVQAVAVAGRLEIVVKKPW